MNGKRNIDIADALNKAGLRGQLCNKFNSAHIHEIIINEKYIGTYKSIHICVEDAIPAIIDKKLWERAQAKTQENKKRGGAAKAIYNYILSGEIICGECGMAMGGNSSRKSNGNIYTYYRCKRRQDYKDCDKKISRFQT
ncbi:hypothetical protein AGMMS49975_26250 [Clostridia bacterium]|nr:hypothetical protein AGMMS49975_26250 [Clostridia bacterium]